MCGGPHCTGWRQLWWAGGPGLQLISNGFPPLKVYSVSQVLWTHTIVWEGLEELKTSFLCVLTAWISDCHCGLYCRNPQNDPCLQLPRLGRFLTTNLFCWLRSRGRTWRAVSLPTIATPNYTSNHPLPTLSCPLSGEGKGLRSGVSFRWQKISAKRDGAATVSSAIPKSTVWWA